MPLIPADVGLRLRLDNELQTQQVAPLKEIAADLPRLQAGQAFTAQIRDVLPQNTYLALVGGKQVTLSLPENVKSGDVLELVVVEQTPKAIIAALADQTAAGKAGTPNTTLSQAGQMLRSILIDEGETPQAAPLNRGQPLLANPPQSGAELAPALQKAVTQSGLFYEAHQAQWVSGKLPLANLRQEPQGQIPVPAQPAPAATAALPNPIAQPAAPQAQAAGVPLPTGANTAPTPAGTQATMPTLPSSPPPPPPPPAAAPLNNSVMQSLLLYQNNQAQSPAAVPAHLIAAPPASEAAEQNPSAHNAHNANNAPPAMTAHGSTGKQPPGTSNIAPQNLPTDEAARSNPASTAALNTAPAMKPMPTLPDELRALVQQQLDAAGTQRLLWHGEVWPGQQMHWQLEWQDQGSGTPAEESEPWQTTLRLTTPRLGTLEAALHLGPAGVRIALNSASDSNVTAQTLRDQAADLESALSAAGVPLRGLTIRHSPSANESAAEET